MRTSRRLRVLVIAHNAVGASNRQRVAALAALPDVHVTLLSPAWWHEEGRRIDVDARPVGSYAWHVGRTAATDNGTRYVYLSGLVGLLAKLQPDVIDLHEEPFSLVALQTLVARALLAPESALVFYSAVNVPRRWRAPYRWIERLVLRRADGAYAPNTEVPTILKRKGLGAPAVCIPLGVDVDRFGRAQPADLAEQLGAAPRPYVGFLGRVEPVKGVEVLVEAVGLLAGPGTVVVAGDGSRREALERLVQAQHIGHRVRFLGPLAFEHVPAFLRALDVLVLPSITLLPHHREQFGRVLAEAMAAGVAVVGTTSGAIPEVIGNAGLVVPEGDPLALARAIDRLTLDGRLRAELAELGRQRASQLFAWPVVVRRTVDEVYRPAAARRYGRSRRRPLSKEEVRA